MKPCKSPSPPSWIGWLEKKCPPKTSLTRIGCAARPGWVSGSWRRGKSSNSHARSFSLSFTSIVIARSHGSATTATSATEVVSTSGRLFSHGFTTGPLNVPEGLRRKLAGGKPAAAGVAPGCRAQRSMPQRGIGEALGIGRPATSPAPLASSGRSKAHHSADIPDCFFDAPRHRATPAHLRGPRPLARTCPRLISFGVPPGRQPCGDAAVAFQTRSIATSPLFVPRVSAVKSS